ncbi:TrmH family RNA methyltransferase [Aureimonas mangrovi]|uniref:TrmH family RNA methyltransferase n=1 Tax=Aureimonas mangrovi TaxID=2758041 RepID=UPI00163DBA37|nr:RNA methyltransferase [Aureimonas mangrovi]
MEQADLLIQHIADARDQRIEPFRDIRERDLVRRGGFIAEGSVVLDELLRSERFRPTALLLLRNRLEGLLPRLARLDRATPVYVAEREVFDAIAGFPVHRGVMAHAERRPDAPEPDPASLARAGALVVVAAGIANHDNMGAIFRAASAFGARAVFLDETACDPLYRKAIRVSVGSALTTPFARLGSVEATADLLQSAGFDCVALSPRGEGRLDLWRPQGPVALFLGAEGPGLPDTVMARLRTLRIAMAPGLDSLNVATAGAIALHHAYACRSEQD